MPAANVAKRGMVTSSVLPVAIKNMLNAANKMAKTSHTRSIILNTLILSILMLLRILF